MGKNSETHSQRSQIGPIIAVVILVAIFYYIMSTAKHEQICRFVALKDHTVFVIGHDTTDLRKHSTITLTEEIGMLTLDSIVGDVDTKRDSLLCHYVATGKRFVLRPLPGYKKGDHLRGLSSFGLTSEAVVDSVIHEK
jgi:hypothetical protein